MSDSERSSDNETESDNDRNSFEKITTFCPNEFLLSVSVIFTFWHVLGLVSAFLVWIIRYHTERLKKYAENFVRNSLQL